MKYTAEEYAKKHNITISLARERLKDMYESGSATRKRTGMIGGTFAYEVMNDLKAHDPFNLGGHKRGKFRKTSASVSDTSD